MKLTFATQAILDHYVQNIANSTLLEAAIDKDIFSPFKMLLNIKNFAVYIEDDSSRSGFRLPDGKAEDAVKELKRVVEGNFTY